MTTKKKNSVETAVSADSTTHPVREYPEEAYDFDFEDPGYTLEDLLAQIPKSETPESNADAETAVAKGSATQPVRQYPEEAYFFTAEELEESPDAEEVKAPSPAKRTRTEEPRIRVRKPDYTLEDLLAQVTEDNRHEVVDFGPPVGKEVW